MSLPICRPVVLKTLAAICIAHESPPLIRSELVLDSRWAEMCCTSQTLPKDCGCSLPQNPNAINYLGSQRIVTCFKDRGLQCQFSQTCEGCEWLLLGFFFGSFLGASSPPSLVCTLSPAMAGPPNPRSGTPRPPPHSAPIQHLGTLF